MQELLCGVEPRSRDGGDAEDGHHVFLQSVGGRGDAVVVRLHHQGDLVAANGLQNGLGKNMKRLRKSCIQIMFQK